MGEGSWTLLLLLLLSSSGLGQDAESLFQKGNERLKLNDYKGALTYLRQALELAPDEPGILFNTGLAANKAGDYALGITVFTRFRKLVPDYPLGLTKLIQAHQGAGDSGRAEKLIDELRGLWKAGELKGSYIAKERSFLRHEFKVGKHRVMAFEFLEPDLKAREHSWDFSVFDENDKKIAMYYLMVDEMANSISGKTKTGTPHYFNVRWAAGGGTLVGLTERRPSFAEAVSIIKRAMAGQKVGPLIKLP